MGFENKAIKVCVWVVAFRLCYGSRHRSSAAIDLTLIIKHKYLKKEMLPS